MYEALPFVCCSLWLCLYVRAKHSASFCSFAIVYSTNERFFFFTQLKRGSIIIIIFFFITNYAMWNGQRNRLMNFELNYAFDECPAATRLDEYVNVGHVVCLSAPFISPFVPSITNDCYETKSATRRLLSACSYIRLERCANTGKKNPLLDIVI